MAHIIQGPCQSVRTIRKPTNARLLSSFRLSLRVEKILSRHALPEIYLRCHHTKLVFTQRNFERSEQVKYGKSGLTFNLVGKMPDKFTDIDLWVGHRRFDNSGYPSFGSLTSLKRM